MGRRRPNPRGRLVLFFVVLAVLAATAWFLLPAPFSHGLILGLLLGPLLIAVVVLLLLRVMQARVRARANVPLEPPPLPTDAWDYAMELVDLDGTTVDLREAEGRVLVLNFWSTRCAPCLAEMPALVRLRDATADLDVRFALVSHDERAAVERFLERQEIDLPVYLASGEIPEPFRHRAIPATFVLARNGTVALRHFGAAAWDAEEVVGFVRTLATLPVGLGSL